MKELIEVLFGEYIPVTYETIVQTADGFENVSVIPAGLAGVDWTYVLGVGLFAITLFCAFRILGGILKR